jgi:hypothetical protein
MNIDKVLHVMSMLYFLMMIVLLYIDINIVIMSMLQHELQYELQHESLYGKVLQLITDKSLSTNDLSIVLGQKRISGQLKKVFAKLRNDRLIEWSEQAKRSSKQKYYITDRGKAFIDILYLGKKSKT